MQADNSEQVILDPKLIAGTYMRTWFFLDLISSVPLDYIFLIFNSIQGTEIYVGSQALPSSSPGGRHLQLPAAREGLEERCQVPEVAEV